MLTSVKIQKRQSEIRQKLAELSGKDAPTEEELNELRSLDTEFQNNEVRYRGALLAEDQERRDAGKDLETREAKELDDLLGGFELRQVVGLLTGERNELEGRTAELVQEMRGQGGYKGTPIPWEALRLERRAGETVSSGTPDPIRTMPIIDQLFPDSVAARMGAQMVDVGVGAIEWPVSLGAATVGWQTSETGDVGGPSAYATEDRVMRPDSTLGVQMKITRKALKQSGAGLEQAVRREMNSAIGTELDRVVFQGSGGSGEPSGILTFAELSPEPFLVEANVGPASWAVFRQAITDFLLVNAATGPSSVKMLLRPEVWNSMDDLISGTEITEWDRLLKNVPAANIVLSHNALPDPTAESPDAATAILTTSAGGVAPFVVGKWGGIDLIRDPYSDAKSGGLRLTALATVDVNYLRGSQIGVLHGITV